MSIAPELHAGTLSDSHILRAAQEKHLITENFEASLVKQACYELRASNTYYELNKVDRDSHPIRHELPPSDFILLKPKQFVVIITHETIELPDNIVARVLTKGKLFSIGISPINTYADPGFKGKLGIVLGNLSNNYIRIPQLEPIAKIEFTKLRKSVDKPYDGQHGYKSQMWPVPYHFILSDAEAQRDPRVVDQFAEMAAANGQAFAEVAMRVFKYERLLIRASIGYFTLSALILFLLAWGHEGSLPVGATIALAGGVISNLIFLAITQYATSLRK
jgi:dCTP deaminase